MRLCDCSCADVCPFGKVGSAARCLIPMSAIRFTDIEKAYWRIIDLAIGKFICPDDMSRKRGLGLLEAAEILRSYSALPPSNCVKQQALWKSTQACPKDQRLLSEWQSRRWLFLENQKTAGSIKAPPSFVRATAIPQNNSNFSMKLITLRLGEDRRLPKGFWVVAHEVNTDDNIHFVGMGNGSFKDSDAVIPCRIADGKADSPSKVRRVLNAAFAKAGRAQSPSVAKVD